MKKNGVLKLLAVLLSLSLLFSACSAKPADPAKPATDPKTEAPKDAAPADKPADTTAEKPAETPPAAPAADKTYKIGVVLMALNSDYWHMVEAGCYNGGKALGAEVSVVGPNAESDVTGQIAMVEDMIAKKVDAIILARNDPTALLPVCQKAKDAGISVITIDGDIADANLRSSFIGTENIDAAKLAGKYMGEKLPKGSEVAIIRGLPGAPTHDKRAEGFTMEAEAAGLKVVTVQPADSERAKAVGVAENILQANPNVKGIYATNDEMALGAFETVNSMGKDILVIGFDGSPDALKSIADKKLTATVAQMPIKMGSMAIEMALKVLKGEMVESHIKLDAVVVDSATVTDFKANIDKELEAAKQK